MKIRTQDAKRYLDYAETYAEAYGSSGQAAVYALSLFYPEPVCIGIYEDMSRAKGVLYEMGLAHQKQERVFYAPAA